MELCCLGEALIDFTPAGLSAGGMSLYERNPGGAPANVAVAAARLGLETAFFGKVGADAFGLFLRDTLAGAGVDTRGLVLDADVGTTLAFVDLRADGERDFTFVRGGDARYSPDELDRPLLQSARLLHLGTLSLTGEPAKSAALEAVRLAKAAGAVICCDVNYRAPLWPGPAAFLRETEALLPMVDALKLSAEEALLLTGEGSPEAAAAALRRRFGLSSAAVTLGAAGAYLAEADGGAYVPGFPARAVDATGAGDCFWAAYLFARLRGLAERGRFACAAASLCVEARGGIPAMPALPAVLARLG